MSFSFRYREDPSQTLHEETVDLDQEDTETESESESAGSCDGDSPVYRDEEVFLGPISSEEMRVNKRIGGRRPTVVPRPSVLPTPEDTAMDTANDDQSAQEVSMEDDMSEALSHYEDEDRMDTETAGDQDEEVEEVDHTRPALLVQSAWRMSRARREWQQLKKERMESQQAARTREAMSQLLRQEVLPSLCDQVESVRKKRMRTNAEQVMQQMITTWQDAIAQANTTPESPARSPKSFPQEEEEEEEETVALIEVSMEEEDPSDESAVAEPIPDPMPSEEKEEEATTNQNQDVQQDSSSETVPDVPSASSPSPPSTDSTQSAPCRIPTNVKRVSPSSGLPDIIQTIRQRVPIGVKPSTTSTINLEERLAALRKARLELQGQVLTPPEPRTTTHTPSPLDSFSRTNDHTNDGQKDCVQLLEEKKQFLAHVKQKRMALREQLLAGKRVAVPNKENVYPVAQ